jgi:hypothetical protein
VERCQSAGDRQEDIISSDQWESQDLGHGPASARRLPISSCSWDILLYNGLLLYFPEISIWTMPLSPKSGRSQSRCLVENLQRLSGSWDLPRLLKPSRTFQPRAHIASSTMCKAARPPSRTSSARHTVFRWAKAFDSRTLP